MTLILSAVAGPYIVQVSDRRLTFVGGHLADDESNKALLVDGRAAMAYTGLAKIGRLRTDHWLAGALTDEPSVDLGVRMQAVSTEATEAFKRLPSNISKTQRRHAFVAVGWVWLKEDEGKLAPIVISISNALDEAWSWQSEASDEFTVKYRVGTTDGLWCCIASHGCNVSLADKHRLLRSLKKYVGRGIGPEATARLLKSQIEKISTTNISVGKNLMIVSLPHPVLVSQGGAFLTDMGKDAALTMHDNASFRYVSADGVEIKQFSPIVVNAGTATELQITPLDDTGTNVDMRLTKIYDKSA